MISPLQIHQFDTLVRPLMEPSDWLSWVEAEILSQREIMRQHQVEPMMGYIAYVVI